MLSDRKAAKAAGHTCYLGDRPCKRGHDPIVRYVCTGNCVECLKLTAARRRESKPEDIRRQKAAYYQDNKEATIRRARSWYASNKSRARVTKDNWRISNIALVRVYGRNYRARTRSAEGEHTKEDIQSILVAQKFRCALCRKSVRKNHHVDHIIPLALGGSNYRRNLQVLCLMCNCRKQDKHPIVFAQSLGLLV